MEHLKHILGPLRTFSIFFPRFLFLFVFLVNPWVQSSCMVKSSKRRLLHVTHSALYLLCALLCHCSSVELDFVSYSRYSQVHFFLISMISSLFLLYAFGFSLFRSNGTVGWGGCAPPHPPSEDFSRQLHHIRRSFSLLSVGWGGCAPPHPPPKISPGSSITFDDHSHNCR